VYPIAFTPFPGPPGRRWPASILRGEGAIAVGNLYPCNDCLERWSRPPMTGAISERLVCMGSQRWGAQRTSRWRVSLSACVALFSSGPFPPSRRVQAAYGPWGTSAPRARTPAPRVFRICLITLLSVPWMLSCARASEPAAVALEPGPQDAPIPGVDAYASAPLRDGDRQRSAQPSPKGT
jgi:hypothetical protein